MLSSLTLDNNKKVANGESPEKIKSFDTNLETTMSKLTSGKALKFYYSV